MYDYALASEIADGSSLKGIPWGPRTWWWCRVKDPDDPRVWRAGAAQRRVLLTVRGQFHELGISCGKCSEYVGRTAQSASQGRPASRRAEIERSAQVVCRAAVS